MLEAPCFDIMDEKVVDAEITTPKQKRENKLPEEVGSPCGTGSVCSECYEPEHNRNPVCQSGAPEPHSPDYCHITLERLFAPERVSPKDEFDRTNNRVQNPSSGIAGTFPGRETGPTDAEHVIKGTREYEIQYASQRTRHDCKVRGNRGHLFFVSLIQSLVLHVLT